MLAKTLVFARGGRARHQGTLDTFTCKVRRRLDDLRGAHGEVSADGCARAARRRLIHDAYEVLRGTDAPGGVCVAGVVRAIAHSDASTSPASSCMPTAAHLPGPAARQLELWVDAALRALEETGHAYRSGLDECFLASISDKRLDDRDLDDLVSSAYSPSNLWTIAAHDEACRESATEDVARESSDNHPDGLDDTERASDRDPAREGCEANARKRRRAAMGDLTQMYTTTHELRARHTSQAAPPSCLWGWKGGLPVHQYVGVGRECTGRLTTGALHRLWSAALRQSSKAVVNSNTMGPAPRPQLGTSPVATCMEYNPSGEYLLCARADGNLTIFRSCSIAHRMRASWNEAETEAELTSVRDVRGVRSVDCAHWNPANRNELATSSRSSGDLHIFDMKVCGIASARGPQHSRHAPTTVFSQKRETNGSVLDFAFVPAAQSLLVAGTTKGAVVLWDARNSKTNKGVLKHHGGGVCYLRMLRDERTVVAGTTGGNVHLWDIRAARASMAVLTLGSSAPGARPFLSVHVSPQLPALNADSDVVPGSVAATTDDTHLRTYDLEPVHEADLAFAFGNRTAGILNLHTGRVTHAFYSGRDEAEDLQRRRLAWIPSPTGLSTLALRNSDDPTLSLFHLRAPQGARHSFGVPGQGEARVGSGGVQHIMKEQHVLVPRCVAAMCGSPVDASLALGFKDASLGALRFGQGDQD